MTQNVFPSTPSPSCLNRQSKERRYSWQRWWFMGGVSSCTCPRRRGCQQEVTGTGNVWLTSVSENTVYNFSLFFFLTRTYLVWDWLIYLLPRVKKPGDAILGEGMAPVQTEQHTISPRESWVDFSPILCFYPVMLESCFLIWTWANLMFQ